MDSAVAALRLIDEGCTLETATVRLWAGGDRRSCCSPGALQRARKTADWLGLPHHFVDREAEFEAAVVEPFVAAYLGGETPNPCVSCNPRRLAALVGLADELGLARVATGHYARLVWRDGEPYVARAADRAKDQSYMLWAVTPQVLARLEFPLGESTKRETRAAAEVAGLPVAGEPESQEVCFAVDGYRPFLESQGVPAESGDIVDGQGRVVGRHEGHWRYTVGQRRGLGVTAPRPLYVLALDAAAQRVMVGEERDLARGRLVASDVNWLSTGRPDGPRSVEVQVRYRHVAAAATLVPLTDDRVEVRFTIPQRAVAPGQAAVFYDGEVCLGGGWIEAAFRD